MNFSEVVINKEIIGSIIQLITGYIVALLGGRDNEVFSSWL